MTSMTATVERDATNDPTFWKVTLRLMPYLAFLWCLAWIDRVNIGFAKLTMLNDLKFSETVYGLGANALDATAVGRIFEAKGRPPNNPLIVHVAELALARQVVAAWPESAALLAERFWPGPLTLVLPKRSVVKPVITHPAIDHRVHGHRHLQCGVGINQRHQG